MENQVTLASVGKGLVPHVIDLSRGADDTRLLCNQSRFYLVAQAALQQCACLTNVWEDLSATAIEFPASWAIDCRTFDLAMRLLACGSAPDLESVPEVVDLLDRLMWDVDRLASLVQPLLGRHSMAKDTISPACDRSEWIVRMTTNALRRYPKAEALRLLQFVGPSAITASAPPEDLRKLLAMSQFTEYCVSTGTLSSLPLLDLLGADRVRSLRLSELVDLPDELLYRLPRMSRLQSLDLTVSRTNMSQLIRLAEFLSTSPTVSGFRLSIGITDAMALAPLYKVFDERPIQATDWDDSQYAGVAHCGKTTSWLEGDRRFHWDFSVHCVTR